MNRIAPFVIAAVTAAGLFVTPVTTASAAPSDSATAALARLQDLNNQVEQANAKLDAATRRLADDQKAEAALNLQMDSIARLQYKRPVLLIQFLEAGSLSEILGDISSEQLIASKERHLLLQARDLRRRDQQSRDEAAGALKTAQASRDEAKKLADAAVAQRDAAIRAQALALAQPPVSSPATWTGTGKWPNHFTYGYCTWYVANRRYIPWFGNAIDWWPNARPYGYSEGQVPQVGAVMVTRESGYGHVAYVEAVYSDGSWLVSEMNYTGWDQESSRRIHPGQGPLVGFIY